MLGVMGLAGKESRPRREAWEMMYHGLHRCVPFGQKLSPLRTSISLFTKRTAGAFSIYFQTFFMETKWGGRWEQDYNVGGKKSSGQRLATEPM